ncbi:hypothetical protein J6590_099780, partial [Homalodisca vitripennis]
NKELAEYTCQFMEPKEDARTVAQARNRIARFGDVNSVMLKRNYYALKERKEIEKLDLNHTGIRGSTIASKLHVWTLCSPLEDCPLSQANRLGNVSPLTSLTAVLL